MYCSLLRKIAHAFLTIAMLTSFVDQVSGQMIVAHRGASYDAPENTIAAFEEAWKQEADGVEADFYVTKDQQIVCIHDANTERTAGKKLEVAQSTLAELRALDYGSWKHPRFKGEPIPTFAEVMAVIPSGKLFVIELKTGPEIVPLLKTELERLKPRGRDLLIIAFNKDTVAAVKQDLPMHRVHWLTGYKKNKTTGVWHPTTDEVLANLKSTGADGLGTQGNREIVTASWAESLTKSGVKEFHVWTIDEPKDAEFFQSLNVIGITTNRPAFIRAALTR